MSPAPPAGKSACCHIRSSSASPTCIYAKILQGARNPVAFHRLRIYFGGQRFHTFADPVGSHASAARMYLDCRREDVTVRSTVACLIAQCAIESELVLLHHDMDFKRIVRVVLKLKEKIFLE